MANRRVFAHPLYFSALKMVKIKKGIFDMVPIIEEMHRILTTADNPLADAQPIVGHPGRWLLNIGDVSFVIEPDGEDIRLISAA